MPPSLFVIISLEVFKPVAQTQSLRCTTFLNSLSQKTLMANDIVKLEYSKDLLVSEDSDLARDLYSKFHYGLIENKKVQLHPMEALHLMERKKVNVFKGKKELSFDAMVKLFQKSDERFWTKYVVFKNLRNRGYIVKTALKFGADFRVYDRGIKPGEDHAKWLVYAVTESEKCTWQEFSAKNRVANSTKKRLLIGIVDAENDVTYYEIRWIRP